MADTRQRYKIVKLDKNQRVIPKDLDEPGTLYVRAMIYTDLNSKQKKHRNARKFFLRCEDGSLKPWKEFVYYPNRVKRKPHIVEELIHQAIDQLAEKQGVDVLGQDLYVAVDKLREKEMI